MKKYDKYVKVTALADMGLFTLLALPYVSIWGLDLLFDLGFFLGDTRMSPDLTGPFVRLSINLMGLFGLFTVWLRLQAPYGKFGATIGVLKLAAAAMFGLSVLMGTPLILLLLLLVDLVTGAQLIFRRPRN